MSTIYYIILVAMLALGVSGYFLLKKYTKWQSPQILKGAGLVLALIFLIRYLSGMIVLRGTIGLNINSPFGANGQEQTFYSVLLLWATFSAFVLLITYPFYKDKVRSLLGLVKFFALIVYLLNAVFMPMLLTAMRGENALQEVSLQGVFYAIEIGFSLAFCVVCWVENYKTKFDLKQIGKSLLIILGMLIASIPSYAPQAILGYGKDAIKLENFTLYHRLALYAAFIMPLIITIIFGKFDYHHRRYALLFLSLVTMINYCAHYSFETLSDPLSWPLHLCNTAMFIIPICLIFKLDKVFYFTMFINVLGAFFAMLMPNVVENWLSTGTVNFWLNHYCAFFMPVLCLSLRIYERPKLKQFIYSLIGFGAYFLLVLFLNAWFSNYGDADFFFINSDFIADKLGDWALHLRDFTWEFQINELTFLFYPIYQVLFFLVYVLLSLAMWFLYEQAFQVVDLYLEIAQRNKKIKVDRLALEVRLNGRNIMEPMNMDGTNKLILRNFSKKYATSDVYAVKDACLEIEGGQIFGFLGPNGAGKSTIIKSIVGIQSISSGAIEVCGYDVEKQSVGAKMQTGFVPDHYALYENLTGREYVNYIADLYGVSKEERTQRIEEYVERFNLHASFDNPMKTYSHGMKQKITIMSALVHNPKLWILDEPLTGLDPESIFQVKEAMKKHAQEGNIVFFSSHIIDVVERICDRIAIIKKGTILCERSVKELEEQGIQLENFYMNMIEQASNDAIPVEAEEVLPVEAAEEVK